MRAPRSTRCLLVLVALVAACGAGAGAELPASIRALAQRGPRTAAERALLAAATIAHPSLAPTDDTHCGLGAATGVARFLSSYTPEERAYLHVALGRPAATQRSILSPSGHFRVHFDTTGINRVDSTDSDGNGVPDYIDATLAACDSVWDFEVNVLGYPAPPSDSGRSGDDAYDIFVTEWDYQQHFYGLTTPDYDNPLNAGEPFRYTTFMTIDNDFAESYYSTHGTDGMRVTIAHEFFHAIQIASYGIWNTPSMTVCDDNAQIPHRYFFEMSSVWMETMAYPEIRDYLGSSVGALFGNTPGSGFRGMPDVQFGITPCDYGYSLVLFLRYIVRHITSDAATVRNMWVLSRREIPVRAIDEELRARGSSLADAWCMFSRALLSTSQRATDTSAWPAFEGAALPPMAFTAAPMGTPAMLADDMHPLSAYYYAFIPSGTADTVFSVVTSRDTVRGLQRDTSATHFALRVGAGESIPITRTNVAYTFAPDAPVFCVDCFRDQVDRTGDRPPYPDPFVADGIHTLFFPTEAPVHPKSVDLAIYTVSGTRLYHASLSPETVNGIEGVSWSGMTDDGRLAAPAVYVTMVTVNGDTRVGKIAVVRK